MPPFLSTLGLWDFALVLAVSLQATVLAYLYKPRLKALVFMLPIPFTFIALAVGKPIDDSTVAGLFLLIAYMFVVRFLHLRLKFPIIAGIATATLGYCLLGGLLNPILPKGPIAFWSILLAAAFLSILILYRMPKRSEPGQRSNLPVYIKLPIMAAVIILLMSIKSLLGGLIAFFPIMAMITAYEARHSLYTLCRQVPILILFLAPMLATIYLAQPYLPPILAILTGWLTYLAFLIPFGGIPNLSLNARRPVGE